MPYLLVGLFVELVANFVAEAESPAVADRQDFRKAGGIETLDEFRYKPEYLDSIASH